MSRVRTTIAPIAVICAVCMCLAGCGWPFGATPSSPSIIVHAGISQNGTTMTLHAGQTLLVTLGSTYWSFQGSSDPQVLAPVGVPIASPGQCSVPGCGAGTVSQEFRANAPGTAHVTASRVSCGEAMACNPGGAPEHYQVTVTVTAASG